MGESRWYFHLFFIGVLLFYYRPIVLYKYYLVYLHIKTINDMAKVIHVHLLQQIDGVKRRDWYFSSLSAVFTVFTPEQVGVTKNYLLHAGLSGGGVIINKRAVIRQSTLIGCSRG